jgi:membrane-associated phospholipid phosphatase
VAERSVRRFSKLGEYAYCWLAIGSAGAALDPRRRGEWGRATLVVAGSFVANTAIKFAIGRKRPRVRGLAQLTRTTTQLSFPSAHATTSFAAARAYGSLIPARPLYTLAVPMALSRLYLGVHYPSDIVGGAVLGTALGEAGRAHAASAARHPETGAA